MQNARMLSDRTQALFVSYSHWTSLCHGLKPPKFKFCQGILSPKDGCVTEPLRQSLPTKLFLHLMLRSDREGENALKLGDEFGDESRGEGGKLSACWQKTSLLQQRVLTLIAVLHFASPSSWLLLGVLKLVQMWSLQFTRGFCDERCLYFCTRRK